VLIFLALLSVFTLSFAAERHFDTYKKGDGNGHTLLVIGGVHGDEPGGFFAPSILIQHYQISNGSLWIVPNLNFDSIVRNQRGAYGDLNRKFDRLSLDDKDYVIIQDIKALILNPRVDLLLNLHDGHGFYRESWENTIFNPGAWGQTCIIDQNVLDINSPFKNLDAIARHVSTNLNKSPLEQEYHDFHVKNTETKDKDEQMQLSLTYFAVTHEKPAFAIETSKNLTKLERKVQYQLRAIEEFLKVMAIHYKRDFDLDNYEQVSQIVNELGVLTLNNQMSFHLSSLKKDIYFVPLKDAHNLAAFTHPLGSMRIDSKKQYQVSVGNQLVTTLHPQYFELETQLDSIKMVRDGEEILVQKGSTVAVRNSFKILVGASYRVNIIGFTKEGVSSESDVLVSFNEVLKRYSIDTDGYKYRVEFYRENKFSGMVIIDFTPDEND
jgi:hypothetical protein